ncbi:MAG: hypothetical protein EB120_07565 [Proteobacteria bacterium]|nr:hypothetical protein [Pseudomonadota bacterium]
MLQEVQNRLSHPNPQAWIPVVPVVETVKRVKHDQVVETLDRSQLFRVQTPQIFDFSQIASLFEQLRKSPDRNFTFTDDASILEHFNIKVGTFPGDERNIKLTYEFELDILRYNLLSNTRNPSCD